MQEAGLDPLDIIKIATMNAAQVLGEKRLTARDVAFALEALSGSGSVAPASLPAGGAVGVVEAP